MQVRRSGKRLWSDGPSFRYSCHPWWHDCGGRLWKQSNPRLLICVWIWKKLSQGNSSKRKWKKKIQRWFKPTSSLIFLQMNVLIFSAGSEPVKLNSIYLIVLPSLPGFSPPSPSQHTRSSENFTSPPMGFHAQTCVAVHIRWFVWWIL